MPLMRNSVASSSGAWTVTIAALGINLVLGVLYAWGVIAKALVSDWKWTKTQAALPFTVSTLAFSIMMIFAGRLQDRIGPRFVAMCGGIILGGGLWASAFAESPLVMLLTFGLIGGIGIGLGYSSTTPPAIKWFPPRRKGLITGIVVSGVGIAAVYISPLTEYLLRTAGISRTFTVMGLGAMLLVSLLAQLLRNPPSNARPGNHSESAAVLVAKPRYGEQDWHEMLRTGQFYLLWTMFVLSAAAGLMLIAHVAIIGKEQAGLGWGFMPVATLAVFNTLGRVVSGDVSDRIGRTRTMVIAFLLQALNMFLFPQYDTPALMLFGSAFAGLCYGAIFTLMPATTADFYGVRNLGVNYGFLFTAFGVAGVLGPVLGGRIRDLSGSYYYSFMISGSLLVAGAVLALFLKNKAPAQPCG